VAAGDPSTFKGKVMDPTFDPGQLELFTTYYWKVDEFSVTGTNPGPVWSFSTEEFIVIQEGDAVLDYDNTAEPFISELSLEVPADLRFGGLADLTLTFQGAAASGVELDEATGTYMITGNGADVWGEADAFHYGYRELTGDATVVARVVDNGTGSNAWAKGGVMIRQSLEAGSQHAIMAITGGEGGGGAFQWRPVADGGSSSAHDTAAGMAPGYWVRLERVGNTFTGSYSADGETWIQQGDPQTIEMTDPVLIGLFVTSHAAGELRTYTFDNVDIVGDISAEDTSADVGDTFSGNTPAPVFVRLEDTTGASATVFHGNPEATSIETPRQWTISLDEFLGVDATSAAMLHIGVGDGEPGGTGSLTISDVMVIKPSGTGNIVWVSDMYDDNGDGAPDDEEWVDILTAEGYAVNYTAGASMGDGFWRELDDAKIATLNAADLIIVSRNSNSGDYDDGEEPTQWNSVTTPIILSSTHIVRSSRWKWLDTTGTTNLAPLMQLADGSEVLAIDVNIGQTTFPNIDAASVGNGVLLASGDGLPWIVEWQEGVEYYDGAAQTAAGPRMFFAAGTQEDDAAGVGRGEMNLTEEGLEIFLEAVDMMIPGAADITVPGDIVKGVPDDGDWPGAEHPALAIDDNVNTKYLHFKGDFDPDPGTGGTGLRITPLDGASVVTGLTFTTANDVPGRDPVAFELYGSNESIDGPYELIASGEIADFNDPNQEWPRFTKNATTIAFLNDVLYKHYQIIFPAIRGPVGGSVNSMQIAEIELLGVLEEDLPTSYRFDGDVLDETWDHDNGSDQWDGTGPGEGNPGGAALLVEDDVTFLRIQDVGDPRDLGIGEPSNRKVYMTRLTDISLDGLHVEARLRVATTPPLDDQVSGDPWPAEGIGYHIRDGGKGMIGVSDGVGIISFSLGQAGEPDYPDATTDLLVMNNLVGTEPSGDVDTGEAAEMNAAAVEDAAQWTTIVIDIEEGGAGTHVVTVSVNDGPAESFDVTVGNGLEAEGPYVTIGSSGTGGITAFDVDYLSVNN
jgi:hypothetical protein